MSTIARLRPHSQVLWTLLLLVPLAGVMGVFLGTDDMEVVRAGVILSVLTVVSLLLFWRVSRADPQGSQLLTVILVSFAFKVLMAWFRHAGGLLADAYAYDAGGKGHALMLARGEWPTHLVTLGTSFVKLLVALFYYAAGVSFGGISILWAWFGTIGMLFFHLAFTTAFPQGHRRLYTLMIFLYPSLLLWTSSLGKDALVIMLLGMAAYGVARLQHRFSIVGLWWLVLGLVGVFWIRPHIVVLFLLALGISSLILPIRASFMTPIVRLAGWVVIALTFQFVVATSGYAVFLEEPEVVLESIGERQWRSLRGGSGFEQVDIRSAAGLAMAVPTILFRPFPWEAHRVTALIASLEGLGLLALMLYRRRSVAAAMSGMFRNSYLLFVSVYILLFIFLFSAFGNFGIIARQRASMFFPFLFMWVAYLAPRQGDSTDAGGEQKK